MSTKSIFADLIIRFYQKGELDTKEIFSASDKLDELQGKIEKALPAMLKECGLDKILSFEIDTE